MNTAGTGGALIDTSTDQTITGAKTCSVSIASPLFQNTAFGDMIVRNLAGGGANNRDLTLIARNIIISGGTSVQCDNNFQMTTAGKAISIKSGTNQRAGNATLVGGTIAVANTTVTANTVVMMSPKTAGGTLGSYSYTLSAGVSFTINSSSAIDTSTISYFLIEVP